MLNKNYPGFNKVLNRRELQFSIYCTGKIVLTGVPFIIFVKQIK